MIVVGQIPHQCADKFVVLARHHEADREAGGVRSGGDEIEATERTERSPAFEIHVQDNT